MTDIFIFEETYQRLAATLAARVPDVGIVCWSVDGTLTKNGQPVDAGAVSPAAGWINSDLFAAGCVKSYGQALLGFDSIQWTQSAHAGLDQPIYPALCARGVRLTKSGAQSVPIAEYVIAHALGHFQGLHGRRQAQDKKKWQPHRFRELWHSNWLIIGYGHIGRGAAKRAKAFDANVVAIRRSQTPDEFADTVAPLSALLTHLPHADVVLLACPATDETRGLANAQFFSALKEGALLINVARGALVDETDLIAGLDQAKPEHAVLDVFETEPLPEASPLWAHPAVTITAHTSNAGTGTRERGDELFLTNLQRYLDGHELLDEVAPADLI